MIKQADRISTIVTQIALAKAVWLACGRLVTREKLAEHVRAVYAQNAQPLCDKDLLRALDLCMPCPLEAPRLTPYEEALAALMPKPPTWRERIFSVEAAIVFTALSALALGAWLLLALLRSHPFRSRCL